MRRAASDLELAIVELGPLPLQLHAYFDRVELNGSSKSLLLSPIAASALPKREYGPVRVHCMNDTNPWTLVCRSIVPVSDHCAKVDLNNARIVATGYVPRPMLPRYRQLTLVTPVGVHGSDANVFPIIELDADTCVLDAATTFELGQYLPIVEIVGDRQTLRRCAGNVFQIIPWCTPDGSRLYRCLVRLSEHEPSVEDGLLETVSDPARVRRTLEFAAMSTTLGWYELTDGSRGEARFFDAGRDKLGLSVFPPRDDRVSARFIKLGFSLFAVDYEMTVRVLEDSPTQILTALPLNIRRGRSFKQEKAPPESTPGLHVRFVNPVTGGRSDYPVARLSMHKLACEVSAQSELLWEGLPLEDAYLCGSDREIKLGDLRVKSVTTQGRLRRVELTVQNPDSRDELTSLVSSSVHSEVSIHDGHNFRGMLSVYKEAGLFAPHMRDNIDPIIPQAKRIWHAMHQPGAGVIQTFVHGRPEAPDGTASVIRLWEHGWLGQHVATVSQQFNGAAGHLQLALSDYVQHRPDGQYFLFFVKSDNHQMNAFHERFRSTSGTPEATQRPTIQFWMRNGTTPQQVLESGDCRVGALRPSLEAVVGHAAERVLGANAAAALSLVPGEFQLADTEARFKQLGIARSRVCSVVTSKRKVPLWAVIEEVTSQGVNFTWMLNASWLFPVHGTLDRKHHGLAAALEHILRKPAQTPTGDVFINSVGEVDDATMARAGFRKLADVYLYAWNRTGMNRFFYYASDRYGEVDARTQQRQARRSGVRLKSGESMTSIIPKVRAS